MILGRIVESVVLCERVLYALERGEGLREGRIEPIERTCFFSVSSVGLLSSCVTMTTELIPHEAARTSLHPLLRLA